MRRAHALKRYTDLIVGHGEFQYIGFTFGGCSMMKTLTNLTLLFLTASLLSGCGIQSIPQSKNQVEASLAEITNQYKRRADLIPNLVSVVKGAANFEQETLTRVVEARAKATSVQVDPTNLTPEKIAEFQQAQAGVSSALSRLLAVVENYPDLKANQNFLQLQGSLEGIENDVKNSRKVFNDAVNSYNVKVRSFPMNMLSGIFGFHKKEGFKADEGAEKAPKVEF